MRYLMIGGKKTRPIDAIPAMFDQLQAMEARVAELESGFTVTAEGGEAIPLTVPEAESLAGAIVEGAKAYEAALAEAEATSPADTEPDPQAEKPVKSRK